MILFEKDFREQNAYIHENTRNDTFIRTSMLLQKLGVRNFMFPLALYQKDLMGIDPHNPKHITTEVAEKIALEIKINPWYYFREVIRIPSTGSKPTPFLLNRGNLAQIWCFYNNIDVASVQPRQTGKTMGAISITSHVLYFLGLEFNISMLTKDASLVQENVARLKGIRDAIPKYLMNLSAKDRDNKEGLTYDALKNKYLTYVNAHDDRNAYRIARGQTTSMQHWDEIAYFNYIWITYSSALASTGAAVRNAKAYGMPHSNLLTTTAGRPDTESGAFVADLLNSACRFHESLYDSKDKADLEDIVTKNSYMGNKLIYSVFSHRQLGYTDAWLKAEIIRGKHSQESADRDFLNIWKAGSDNGVVPQHLIDKMNENRLEPVWVENTDNYLINWYVSEELLKTPEYKNRSYIAGMDASELIGSDYTTYVVIDPYDLGVVATLRCNESNILYLARRLAKVMITYPKMVMIPETKSTGRAILDIIIDELLQAGINPWFRIFNQAIQRRDEAAFRNFNLHNTAPDGLNRKLFGYNTSGGDGPQSRNLLYKTVMIKALEINHDRIYDESLIREFGSLCSRNGRIDHRQGGNDDMIISYLLANYLAFFGKNLHLYGIDTGRFLHKAGKDKDAKVAQERTEQIALRSRINLLEDRLKRCPTEIIKHSYIREIKNLQALINAEIDLTDPIAKVQVARDNDLISTNPNITTVTGLQDLQRWYRPRIPQVQSPGRLW